MTKMKKLSEALLLPYLPSVLKKQGLINDLDEAVEPGVYTVLESSLNRPPSTSRYGMLIVFASSQYTVQVWINYFIGTGDSIFIRTREGKVAWRPWAKIAVS